MRSIDLRAGSGWPLTIEARGDLAWRYSVSVFLEDSPDDPRLETSSFRCAGQREAGGERAADAVEFVQLKEEIINGAKM